MAPKETPKAPPHVWETMSLMKRMSDRINKCNREHNNQDFRVPQAELQAFGVHCTPLDLRAPSSTVGAGDGTGFQLLRPVSPKVMASWINAKKPWLSKAFGSLGPKEVVANPSQNFLGLYTEAQSVGSRLQDWIYWADGDEHSRPRGQQHNEGVMYDKTLWRSKIGPLPANMGARRKNITRGMFFQVQWLLEHRDDNGRSIKSSKPHITAFLPDNTPMHEDGLKLAELMTIVHLTGLRILDEVWDYRVIPVTILSASDRDVRVLHAYVDATTGMFNVRKSRIMNFDEGADMNNEDWVQLMCWTLAEPDLDCVRKLERRLQEQRARR